MNSPSVFILTGDHIKLLSRLFLYYDDRFTLPTVQVDTKRPYGNSGPQAIEQACAILGIQPIDGDLIYEDSGPVYPTGTMDHVHKLMRELVTALEIVLRTRKVEPGEYTRASPDTYEGDGRSKWVRTPDQEDQL